MIKHEKKPCKQCGIPYYIEGLIGGDLCYVCMREPVKHDGGTHWKIVRTIIIVSPLVVGLACLIQWVRL